MGKHALVLGSCRGLQLAHHELDHIGKGGIDALDALQHLNNQSDGTDSLDLLFLYFGIVEDFADEVEHHVHARAHTLENSVSELIRVLLHVVNEGNGGLEDELIDDASVIHV